jgi:uncharacterized phage protein gp47/JayE
MTFDVILERMLERVPDDVDKREGSVIYDAVAPAALELARFYSELDNVIDETFADTAGREMLIRRAAERGITPYPATFAIVQGAFVFNAGGTVPIGARFSLGELRYRVTEAVSSSEFRLICENIGTVGNRSAGDLQPVDYIEGLMSARITQLLFPARNDEATEQFRRRYFNSLEVQSYGGNIADYIRMTLLIQGVGGAKVEPAWNGGGTVRLTIVDNQWGLPTQALVNHVRDILDPPLGSGKGEGLAPIGHQVTVVAARGVQIDVTAEFTLSGGWQFADVKPDLEDIVGEYLRELSESWAQTENIIVRAAQIESRLLNEPRGRVVDISGLRLNGGVVGRNVTLAADEIPLRGAVVHD